MTTHKATSSRHTERPLPPPPSEKLGRLTAIGVTTAVLVIWATLTILAQPASDLVQDIVQRTTFALGIDHDQEVGS